MLQLKYPDIVPPVTTTPELPLTPGAHPELFPVITEEGVVTARTTRAVCHSGAMWLHPVVHLHIFNSRGELYLQRRSMKKDIQPGKWDTAVGGHVDYGEQIETALRREAREELGFLELTRSARAATGAWTSCRPRWARESSRLSSSRSCRNCCRRAPNKLAEMARLEPRMYLGTSVCSEGYVE
jgi:hypothetical protein